jgi:hypothetical protein
MTWCRTWAGGDSNPSARLPQSRGLQPLRDSFLGAAAPTRTHQDAGIEPAYAHRPPSLLNCTRGSAHVLPEADIFGAPCAPPQGFEPRLPTPEEGVLPLHQGGTLLNCGEASAHVHPAQQISYGALSLRGLGRNRTCDLCIFRAALFTTELRVQARGSLPSTVRRSFRRRAATQVTPVGLFVPVHGQVLRPCWHRRSQIRSRTGLPAERGA